MKGVIFGPCAVTFGCCVCACG